MSDVLVIGGNGFIGRQLVSRLVDSGHSVRVFSRSVDPRGHRPRGVEFYRGEVGDGEAIRNAVRGVSEVFHLATGGGASWSDFERDFIQSARHLGSACREHGVRRLVYTSSIAALYLGGRGTIRDPAPVDPRFESRANYGRAKAAAEHVLAELHSREGLPVVILRPGVVVGKGTPLTHSGAGLWASDLCCIGWGPGKHPLPFVLGGDVADAMILAMQVPGIDGQAFNLVGDFRPTAREYLALVAERSLRRFQYYPRSLAWLQSIEIIKWLCKVAARKPDNAFPGFHDLKSRSLRAPFDCSTAKNVLGWRPNASREVFVRDAIDANLCAIHREDLRLAAAAS